MAETVISRRGALFAGACFAMLSRSALAAAGPGYSKETDADGMVEIKGIHRGKGTGAARLFRFGNAPWPAHFIVYDLPPGASEGAHTHYLDNRNGEGAFDEYYYITGGQGRMEIDGKPVAVSKGDLVHTPLEVAHGIENTHATEHLRVFLTFIERGSGPSAMTRQTP